MNTALKSSPYDQQASQFDRRTGVKNPEQIATAIAQISNNSGTLVEIGCGTGQIGALLAPLVEHYIGIDLSAQMLKQFASRVDNLVLLQADGNDVWPVEDAQADLIFSSRAIHWLDIEHTIEQAYRVANPDGALLIVGRANRAEDSWESRLRKQCHQLLKQHQIKPRNGNAHLRQLNEAFNARGAEILTPIVVTKWQQPRALQQALDDWANKSGLAGVELQDNIKQQILSELKQWAEATFGHHLPEQTERQYTLYPIKLF